MTLCNIYRLDDNDDKESQDALKELENIDDDTDKHGIQFVKIDDGKVAKEFGIDELPTLVYFENEIPSLYDGEFESIFIRNLDFYWRFYPVSILVLLNFLKGLK